MTPEQHDLVLAIPVLPHLIVQHGGTAADLGEEVQFKVLTILRLLS